LLLPLACIFITQAHHYHRTMPSPFEDFFKNIPPITRAYMTACFLTTLAVHLELVSPLALYFNWDLIYNELEVRITSPSIISVRSDVADH
jgi:hypothetical protein